MQRNFETCPHCGQTLVRLTPHTPLINRSDGMHYHVALFGGPGPRRRLPGGPESGYVVFYFTCANNQFGVKDQTISVVATDLKESLVELSQIEAAADKLAELVQRGSRLTSVYTFDGQELKPGFPV